MVTLIIWRELLLAWEYQIYDLGCWAIDDLHKRLNLYWEAQ